MIHKIIIIAVSIISLSGLIQANDNNYVPGELILMLDRNTDANSLVRDFGSIRL